MERGRRLIINYVIKTVIVIGSLLFLFSPLAVNAKDMSAECDTEIVIVLDCSQSMQNVDADYRVLDFIKGIVSIVPENYEVGIVAYNNEICLRLPLNSGYYEAENKFENIEYRNYGNAGAGLAEAVGLFKHEQAEKRIIMISDGEIMMRTEEETKESAELFAQAVAKAKDEGILIDILAFGEHIEEGNTIYSAAESTSGKLYELTDSGELSNFTEHLLFSEWNLKKTNVGTLDGNSGELSVELPDCFMDKAKIILIGEQQNKNLTVNCKADSIAVYKGNNYTVVEICKPESEEVNIHMSSDNMMNINAYLTAEYTISLTAAHDYATETGVAAVSLCVRNPDGKNLLEGHMNDNRLKVYLNGEERQYGITGGKIFLEEDVTEDTVISLEVMTDELYGNYYGITQIEEEVDVPVPNEPAGQTDWFFWSVILFFAAALTLLLLLSGRKKKEAYTKRKIVDESKMLPKERGISGNDFCGKLLVYVIHSKDDIDYPPESINLFARCSREVITLEWILDICNLPLSLKGADKIVIKPGDDRSLIIKNGGPAAAMKGRELLLKGRWYHLYYHEKVTFIFDQEDTEIEVHYKDLKPNEK